MVSERTMPKLVVSVHGVVVHEWPVFKNRTTLGRRPCNDLVFNSLAVSGEHAVLWGSDTGFTIEDLNSTNGTRVNGRFITRQTLCHGDTIGIGKYQVHFFQHPQEHDHEPATAMGEGAVIGPRRSEAHGQLLVVSGRAAGKSVTLSKASTTVGIPQQAAMAIARQPHGHSVVFLYGQLPVLLNGKPLTAQDRTLQSGDLIDIGDFRMQFRRL